MLQAYGPSRMAAPPTLAHLQPTEFDTVTRPTNPASVQTPESVTARLRQRQTEALLREQGRTNFNRVGRIFSLQILDFVEVNEVFGRFFLKKCKTEDLQDDRQVVGKDNNYGDCPRVRLRDLFS